MLNEIQVEIMKGFVCPYCRNVTQFVDSSIIYGRSYGKIYHCKPCDAYCGVHKGTNVSLGRLANAELRYWKKEAHKYFDMIWKNGYAKKEELYRTLAEILEIPFEYCHFGMFSVASCKTTVTWSKMVLNDFRQMDIDSGIKVERPHFQI